MSALLPTYPPYPFQLVSGQGDQVTAEDGRIFVDFYGGHCVASTGHCHPRVVEAICKQASTLLFYSTAASLPIRTLAAESLVKFAGSHITSVFFCNSGAEANENALKLAAQLTGRSRFIGFQGGFHGRTLLAMSCSDLPKLKTQIAALCAPCELLPFNDVAALERADFTQVAAVIVEPIQSMAGVRTADREWLHALQAKCRASGSFLIIDEVQTGFGRLGKPFAFQHFGIEPDVVTCAKGIASGFPLGAVLLPGAVASRIGSGDLGSTFGGGPLASAALQATLEVIEDEQLCARAFAAEGRIRAGLIDCGSGPLAAKASVITEIRGKGLLLGLVVGSHAAALKDYLMRNGVLVGASSDPAVLRLLPPLTITDESIDRLVALIKAFEPNEAT